MEVRTRMLALAGVLLTGVAFSPGVSGRTPPDAHTSADVLLETITIGATEDLTAKTSRVRLSKGTQYRLEASGTMTVSGPQRFDALYCYGSRNGFTECEPPDHVNIQPNDPGLAVGTRGGSLSTRIDSFMSPDACCVGEAPFQAGHTYSVPYHPDITGQLRLQTRGGDANCPSPSICPETTTGEFTIKIYGPGSDEDDPCAATSAGLRAGAAQSCATPEVVTVSNLERKVEVSRNESGWEPATPDMRLKKGDRIHTGFKAGITLTFPDGSTVRLKPMSLVEIRDLSRGSDNRLKVRLWLKLGEVTAQVNRSTGAASDFNVKTPTTTASIRGTTFSVLYDGSATTVAVTESSVEVTSNNGKTVVVPEGMQTVSTAKGVSKPVKIGRGEKRGGLTAAKALKRLTAKLAKKLAACKFDAVSIRLGPAKGGWTGSFVIVAAGQGIDDKPKGTAKFRLKGKRVRAANALAKKIARGCR